MKRPQRLETRDLLTDGAGLVAIGFIWFDPFQDRFQNINYPSQNWYRKPSDRKPASWMRQVPAAPGRYWSFERLKQGPLQTLLGLILLAFSLVIVIADAWTEDGRLSLYVTAGVLLAALVYWWCFVRYRSARRFYRWFGYELRAKQHGIDDYPSDPQRICHWCVSLRAAHRHPHDSYESFNGIDIRGSAHPRFLYTLFSDGSNPTYLIQSWADFRLALSACLFPEDTEIPVDLGAPRYD